MTCDECFGNGSPLGKDVVICPICLMLFDRGQCRCSECGCMDLRLIMPTSANTMDDKSITVTFEERGVKQR